jgi:type VI protein secretion system component VasK
MLGETYPLLDIFWTMLWIFCFIIYIWVLIAIFSDIFRSHDMGGWAKAAWVIFIFIVPLIGILTYLIVRGHKMTEHQVEDARRQDQAFKAYVQQAAGGTADEVAKLADLRDQGVITEAEFQSQKSKLLT